MSEDDAETVDPVSLGAVLRGIGGWGAKVDREGGNPAPAPDLPAVVPPPRD